MATIHVDGKALEVNGADNLLQACLSLGLDIPYFCWHPALGSVGACRQCAVKQYTDENDTRGRIVMSCMTPASDGTWISIEDDESKAFRASVVEWLMTTPCRDGLPWSVKMLRALENGQGKAEDIETLLGLVNFLGPGRTFCAHAPGAVEPLGSAIKYFRSEFEAGVAATSEHTLRPDLAKPIQVEPTVAGA